MKSIEKVFDFITIINIESFSITLKMRTPKESKKPAKHVGTPKESNPNNPGRSPEHSEGRSPVVQTKTNSNPGGVEYKYL